MRNLILFISVLCVTSIVLSAPPGNLQATIDAKIRQSRQAAGFRQAKIGISIRSLDDRSIWYAKNARMGFVPASTTKAITAAMALEYLPANYRFSTRVLTTGAVSNGILQGDVILQGGGDPTLQPEDLQALATTLAQGDIAHGIPPITLITGQLIADDSFFPLQGPQLGLGWEKDDLPWYYAAPSNALSLHRNALTITVHGTTPNNAAEVTLTPASSLFTVTNRTQTTDAVKTGSIEVKRQGSNIIVTGCVAPGAELDEGISMPNPAKLTREQFLQALHNAGIGVQNAAVVQSGVLFGQPRVLAEHLSSPITEVIYPMLKESDNHIAEQLRWTLLALSHTQVKLSARYAAMQTDFHQQVGGSDWQLNLVDGSGLSRLDIMSPSDAIQVLSYMPRTPYFADYYAALPVAGVDGTMLKRLVGTAAEGNAHAKTGTMRGVCTLAGYVTTSKGERLSFAIFANDYANGAAAARTLQDDIVAYLAGL